ncbi:MAG: energy transducer TonB [Chitinophagaceae bacterium]
MKITLLSFLLIIANYIFGQSIDEFPKNMTVINNGKDTLFTSVQVESYFKGGQNAWIDFLTKNLNSKLGSKYLKIPKGSTSVKQTVKAIFVVNKNGELFDINIENINEVHPMLAEEVIRVLKLSPKWEPGYQNGVAVKSRKRQSISFVVSD